ncbi:MAG: hypothetical protein ABI680_12275 [Chthoniobacteraceae bacterium]
MPLASFRLLTLVVTMALAANGSAQVPDPDGGKTESAAATAAPGEPKSVTALRAISTNLGIAESELEKKRAELAEAAGDEQKKAIGAEIESLRQKTEELRTDFQSVAAGMDWATVTARDADKFNTGEELEQLLRPIVLELKDLTSRPREIENLRLEISRHQKRASAIEQAIAHAEPTLASLPDGPVRAQLIEVAGGWKEQLAQVRNDLSVAQFQLEEKLITKRTVFGTLRELTAAFFRSRGRNLLLAAFAFIFVFGLMRLARWYVLRIRALRSRVRRSFGIRLLDILYYLLCIFGAASASLAVLYASGDWVLLGLAILFFLGLAWASKNVLPGFYEQAKLLLNLGPVREGERVVYRGIPWEVRTINVYTELSNPAFDGARIRLPLRDLMGLISRRGDADAPWFPCERNDWVRLTDRTRGKVVELTPEWVQLVLLGGSRKTYTIPAFLALDPENLSKNFRIRVQFGLDYQHQAVSTTQIPLILQRKVETGLLQKIDHHQLKNLSVEFAHAGASSLDYAILADFDGDLAARIEALDRTINRLLVEAANEHGWIIPFTQVTLHQAAPARPAS